MEKAPSRLFGMAPVLAAALGIRVVVSVDLDSDEARSLTLDDLADLEALGATAAMLADLQERARVPGHWRIDLKAGAIVALP